MAIVIPEEIVQSTSLSEQEFLSELVLWLTQRGYLPASRANELLRLPVPEGTQIPDEQWQAILKQIIADAVPANLPDDAIEREAIYVEP